VVGKLPELRLERRAHFRSRPADDRRVGLRFRTAQDVAAGGHVGGDARPGDAEREPRDAPTTSGGAAPAGDRAATRGDGDRVIAAEQDGSIRAGSGPHDVSSEGDGDAEWVSTEVRDLGVGGAFVATYRALPIGTTLEVEVDLPGSDATLAVRAEVRWLAEPGRQPPGRDAGMGLAFAPLDTDGLLAVSEYLAGAARARA
jgi:Tfp pilus assembly protein PilZ